MHRLMLRYIVLIVVALSWFLASWFLYEAISAALYINLNHRSWTLFSFNQGPALLGLLLVIAAGALLCNSRISVIAYGLASIASLVRWVGWSPLQYPPTFFHWPESGLTMHLLSYFWTFQKFPLLVFLVLALAVSVAATLNRSKSDQLL